MKLQVTTGKEKEDLLKILKQKKSKALVTTVNTDKHQFVMMKEFGTKKTEKIRMDTLRIPSIQTFMTLQSCPFNRISKNQKSIIIILLLFSSFSFGQRRPKDDNVAWWVGSRSQHPSKNAHN